MSIDFKDNTGQPIPVEDFEEAMAVVKKFTLVGIMQLPPELAVQMGNIHRCLRQGAFLTSKILTMDRTARQKPGSGEP